MPQTRFADIVVPRIFSAYTAQRTTELSAFVRSGAVTMEGALDEMLRGGGNQWDAPFWNPLSQSVENVSTDDPAQTSTPQKIASR